MSLLNYKDLQLKISTGVISWEISEDWLVDHSILRKLEDKKLLREEYEEMMGIDPPTEEQRAKTIPMWVNKVENKTS